MDDIVSELGPLEPPLSEEPFYNSFDNAIPQDQSESFCRSSNFNSALNYVNLQLTAQGYPVPLVFHSNDQDACKIVNCLEAILKDKKELLQQIDQVNQNVLELKREQERLQSRLQKTNQELQEQKRENAQLQAKNETTVKAVKAEKDQNRSLKEELSKAKNNMQYMKTQYAHETRRHEQEQAKIKERMYKLMDERHKTNVASMTINDPLPGFDDDDENMDVSEERAMYTDMLKKSSDREKDARKENERMRGILLEMYSAAADLLKRQVDQYQNAFPIEFNRDDLPIFRLPLDIGGAEATNRVHDLLVRLRQEWDRQIAKRKAYSEEDIAEKNRKIEQLTQSNDELMDGLEQLKNEYDEKANIYLRYAEGGFFDSINPKAIAELSDSESSALDDPPKHTSKLKRLERDVKAERERITAAAIQLGDDRTKLAAERWAFQEMKRQLEMNEILADESPPSSPDVGSRRRSTYHDQEETTHERSQKRLRPWLGQAPQS
ncbi:Afadin and alpha-actinin-binding-domain-containing protein [Fennellomyces sp. T-0311]|nr:Afadin and alpha-actinin-binding-domain-containing protein [Fennellomyces sp. T-0311]